jgi:hypothetical protein
MAYTLDDLANAEREVEACRERIDNYRRNNPNHGRAAIPAAQARVDVIVANLKRQGLMPVSNEELLEAELDRAFPNAKSREVVTFNGKKYRRRFSPGRVSRAGNVMSWLRSWEAVKDDPKSR